MRHLLIALIGSIFILLSCNTVDGEITERQFETEKEFFIGKKFITTKMVLVSMDGCNQDSDTTVYIDPNFVNEDGIHIILYQTVEFLSYDELLYSDWNVTNQSRPFNIVAIPNRDYLLVESTTPEFDGYEWSGYYEVIDDNTFHLRGECPELPNVWGTYTVYETI